MNDVERHPGSTSALGQVRCLKEDCSKRPIGRKAKKLK
jgi:hypothetical protein